MKAWLGNLWFAFRFFLATRGSSQRWLRRVWTQLIDHDIHPDEDVEVHTEQGQRFTVSAFGSQLWVKWSHFEFTINFSEASGLYIHQRQMRVPHGEPMEWLLVYRELPPFLFPWRGNTAHEWAYSMKLLAANLGSIEDRREQNTVDYRGLA